MANYKTGLFLDVHVRYFNTTSLFLIFWASCHRSKCLRRLTKIVLHLFWFNSLKPWTSTDLRPETPFK